MIETGLEWHRKSSEAKLGAKQERNAILGSFECENNTQPIIKGLFHLKKNNNVIITQLPQ